MKSTLAVLFGTVLLSGCASDPTPPPASPAGGNESATTGPARPQGGQVDDNPGQANVSISDEIRKACGITETEAFFAYDSARVRSQDKAIFTKLAKCFSEGGALAGRQMRLVGHADPRGDDDYNMLLGERRAGSVKTAVSGAGLKAGQITTTSRGEMDARGTDEESWAKDRRVEIVLGD